MQRYTEFHTHLHSSVTGSMHMPVQACETEHEIIIRAIACGVNPGDIHVELSGQELCISAMVRVPTPKADSQGLRYHRQERPCGVMKRVLRLNCPVETEKITASVHKGILNLVLPKAKQTQQQDIYIISA